MMRNHWPLSFMKRQGGGSSAVPWTATLTVASGKVGSNLSNYPLYVDLDDMPSQFWAATNEGKDLRASVGGTSIAVDLVWCSVALGKGAMFLKVPTLSSGSTTTIDLSGDGVSDRVADNATYGRNAVWADYHAVYLLGQTAGDDRTGGGTAEIWGDPDLFELIETSSTDLNSHQGICWDGTYYYTTDDNAIYKWNSSWTLIASNTNPIADAAIGGSPTVNHLGDVEHFNGKLYIPLECYPASGGLYNAHMVVFNASNLTFDTSFSMTAQAHEASSVAYCPKDGYLYVTDFDANYNKLWKYSLAGSYIGQLTLSNNVEQMQGITWWRDYFWISQDLNDETVRVAYDGTCSKGNLAGGAGGIGFGSGTAGNYEGIGHRDDGLIQHIDPGTTERAEVWRPLSLAKAAQGGIKVSGVLANDARSTGRTSYTTYTLGCTLSVASKGQNRVAVSYATSGTSSGNSRQIIGYRNTNTTLAIWDLNNSWLECSPTINPTLNQSYRCHAVYQGTTARRIYVDGAQKNSQLPITAVPSNFVDLYIGFEDADYLEGFDGKIGFVYLRPSVLSADWIAGEHSNLNAPSSFYSIA